MLSGDVELGVTLVRDGTVQYGFLAKTVPY